MATSTDMGLDLIHAPRRNTAYEVKRRLLAADYPVGALENDLKYRRPDPYGFHIWGPCPNCGHKTSGVLPCKYLQDDEQGALQSGAARAVVKDFFGLAPGETPVSDENGGLPRRTGAVRNVMVFKCACVANHSTDDDKFGCGSEWLLRVEYISKKPSEPVIIEPVTDTDSVRYWAADDDVAVNLTNASSTAQALAKSWVTTLGTLVGLLALSGILAGRDTIQSLPTYFQIILVSHN
jgi:hypothetical protein